MKKSIEAVFFISLMTMLIIIGYKSCKSIYEDSTVEVNVTKPFIELINLYDEVYQQDIYILPEEVEVVVDNEKIKERVIWEKVAVTDTPGKYMYEGYTETHNYCVNLILNVKENLYKRKVGYIRNIYINDHKERIIEFDIAEFFKGEQALNEAIKDNEAAIDNCGNYINPCGYYIRNSNYDREILKINRFPVYELIDIEINDEQRGSLNLVKVDFETLKKYVDNYNNSDDERKLLFYIDIKNNEVMSIVRQYLEYN